MKNKGFNGKAIYKPNGKAGEYAEWACNFYVGCSNGCVYCYCKKGVLASQLGGDTPTLKKCFKDEKHAIEVFEKELLQNLEELRKSSLFFSFTTDPLLAECNDLTWEASMIAMKNGVPVQILTKVCSKSFINLIEDMDDSWKRYLAIGFTLTGYDHLEPNAGSNSDRIICMGALHKANFKTFASIEPVVDVDSSLEMIHKTQGLCDLYKVGLMSGDKYDKGDVYFLISELSKYAMAGRKIYIKDSVLKAVGMERSELPDCFIDRDYDIFKEE